MEWLCSFFIYSCLIKAIIDKNYFDILFIIIKKERAEASVFKYYDKDDLEPWKSMKRQRIKKVLKDLIVLKFRPYIVYLMDLRNK